MSKGGVDKTALLKGEMLVQEGEYEVSLLYDSEICIQLAKTR